MLTKKMLAPANVSTLPAGITTADKPLTSRHYVLTDKYNLAPVSEIITRHIREERANMHPDETLVVIMSEIHSVSDHKLIRASVLTDAAIHLNENPSDRTRKFIYAHELDYNVLEVFSLHCYGISVPNHLKYRPNIYDPDYNLAMQAIIANNEFQHAPQSTNILFRMCLQHNIPTCFNDIAKNNSRHSIDQRDPIIWKIPNISQKIHLLSNSISFVSENGIELRNNIMVVRAMTKAKKIGAKTIIQGTGTNHTLGNRSKKDRPYKTSLTPMFYRAGAHKVIPVFLSHSRYKAEDVIHDKALEENPDLIIIDGIQDSTYTKYQTYEELKNIGLLSQKWNGNAHTFMPTDPPPSKEEVQEKIEEAFDI